MTRDFVFVTGNEHKAAYLSKWLGRPVERRAVELDELQSLDPMVVLRHKAEQAYAQIQAPVLVEDVSLVLPAMGRLPGTLIKWFMEELGCQGMCRLAQGLATPTAIVSMAYVLYDGSDAKLFEGSTEGTISTEPRGESWGFNAIFIPNGQQQTFAKMSEADFNAVSHRGKALAKLRDYLTQEDSHA